MGRDVLDERKMAPEWVKNQLVQNGMVKDILVGDVIKIHRVKHKTQALATWR